MTKSEGRGLKKFLIAAVIIFVLIYTASNLLNIDSRRISLHVAISDDRLGNVKANLSWITGVNTRFSDFGDTPLHVAAENNSLRVAEYLISKGAKINAKDKDGYTPLHEVGMLSRPEKYKKSADVALLLIKHGADIHARTNSGLTPMHTAASHNRYAVVDVLISKGADINAKDKYGWTPVHYVYEREYADKLLEKGARIENIYDAAWLGELDKVKSLLSKNPKLVNKKCNESWTPIYYALKSNELDVVRMLISKGAKLDVTDDEGYTPLFLADSKDAVVLLLENGADPNARANDGMTCVFNESDVAILKALVAGGANINAKDNLNKGALHWSAGYGDVDEVKALIEAGADVNLVGRKNMTPLDYVYVYSRNNQIIKMLTEHGAETKSMLPR